MNVTQTTDSQASDFAAAPSRYCQCDSPCGKCFPCSNAMTQEDLLCDPCRAWHKAGKPGPKVNHCHYYGAL
jgi:hypothetical protein